MVNLKFRFLARRYNINNFFNYNKIVLINQSLALYIKIKNLKNINSIKARY